MTLRYTDHQRGAVDRRVLVVLAAIVVLALAALLLMRGSEAPSNVPATARQQTVAADKPSASSTPAAIQYSPRPAATESARNAPPVAASKETQLEWKGRVLSEATGAPIAGALVEVLATDAQHGLRRGKAVLEQVGRPPAVASATTDAKGEWAIRVSASRVPADEECFYATASGYASRTAVVMLSLWRSGNRLDIPLPDGGVVSGRVVDAGGTGIDDAIVGGLSIDRAGSTMRDNSLLFTYASWADSGPDGAFSLDGVPLETNLRIPARKPGYITGISEIVRAGEHNVRIVLRTGGAMLSGRAIDADDRPARGIHVTAGLEWLPGDDYGLTLVQASSGDTDQDGAFAFTHLPGGKWKVTATREAAGGAGEEVSELISLGEDASATVELRFRKPVTIIGRAFDVDSKAGVPGVRVSTTTYTVYTSEGPGDSVATPLKRLEAISDGAGNFRLTVPYQEAVRLFFKTPDGWIREAGDTTSSMEEIYINGLVGGEERRVEVPFVQGVPLRGKVAFADGRAVPGINVNATEKPNWRQVTAVTDQLGEFVLSVQRNRTIDLMAKGDSGWGEASAQIPASGPPPGVSILLHPYSSVSGTVRTDKGDPVPGVTVLAMRVTEGGGTLSTIGKETVTDEAGHYLKDKMPSGTIRIGLRLLGEIDYALPEPLHVDLLPGERKENQDFVLSAGETIEGTITNEEEEPIAGASIQWYRQGAAARIFGGQWTVLSDKQGHYRITGLEENAVIPGLSVSHDDYEGEYRESITAMDGEQNFTLRRKGSITLVAVDEATNSPITRYDYLLLQFPLAGMIPLGPPPVRVQSADGRTTLSQLDRGTRYVEVAEIGNDGNPTGRRGDAQLVPGGGKKGEVVVRVGGGGSVSGIVVDDKSGEPIEGARVAVYQRGKVLDPASPPPKGTFEYPQATTGRDGRFTLRGLTPGDYQLTALKDELRSAELLKAVVRSDGTSDEVVIRLGAMGAIFGRAIGPGAKALVGASVRAHRTAGGSTPTILTDENGEYRLSRIEPGSYAVMIELEEGSSDDFQRTEVKNGEEKEVNFDLSNLLTLRGTVRIDGSPWRGGSTRLTLQSEGVASGNLRAKDGGRYECRVRPGAYRLQVNEDFMSLGTAEILALPASPAEQSMDFDLTTTSADVTMDPADGVEFTMGAIQMEQRLGTAIVESGSQISTNTARRHLPRILPGEYRASFQAKDGTLVGTSDWTSITPGGENVIYVPVKKTAKQ